MLFRDFVYATCVLAWRFFSGRCMDGKHRTNASFRHPGTTVYTITGRASHWAHMPGYQRAAWRIAGLLTGLTILVGLLFEYEATVTTLRVGFFCALPIATWAGIEKARDYQHDKLIKAAARAIAEKAKHSPESDPHRWIDAPRGFREDPDKVVEITMGEKFSTREPTEAAFVRQAAQKLGLIDPESEWNYEGRTSVKLRACPEPRRYVTLNDIREGIHTTSASQPIMGLGSRDKYVKVDLDDESPHVLMAAGTGGGKSVTFRTIVSQGLYHGGLALILDIKGTSHKWAEGLPNVGYARSAPIIHEVLLWAADEMHRRNRAAAIYGDINGKVDPAKIGPRLFVIVEERNALRNVLREYWNSIKERGEPAKSPAEAALNNIEFMGREQRVHVLMAAQSATAQAVGGPEARENFGTRILARASYKAWAMLAPEIKPVPRKSKIPGRTHVVLSDVATKCQMAFVTPQEARNLAVSGTVATFDGLASLFPAAARPEAAVTGDLARARVDEHSHESEPVSRPRLSVVRDTTPQAIDGVSGDDESEPENDDQGDELVTFTEAVDDGLVAATRAMLKAARHNDPTFPEAAGRRGAQTMTYKVSELQAWDKKRQGREAGRSS